MGVIEAKENIIAEEKEIVIPPSRRVKWLARLLGQDVQSVQSAMSWKQNKGDPDTETLFQPFDAISPSDFRLVYDRCGLVRFACEKMSRDIFQNGISIPKGKSSSRNKNLLIDKKWIGLPTPQNPDWGMRGILARWLTLERKEGWAGIGKTNTGAFLVFSEQEYQDKTTNYATTGEKVKTLRPKEYPCKFELKNAKFEYTFKEGSFVILVTRPKEKDWRGFPLIEPVYAETVYITNIEYGMAQAYWAFGVGTYVMYHPKNTNLKKQKVKMGSVRNRKTLHLHPLDHPNADPLNRVQSVGINSVQGMESELRLYYNIVLAYLEVPETWYFGSGQGTLSTSYMNAIGYQSTIQNEQDDYYSGILKGINLITGAEHEKFEWNPGQIMDPLSKAEMLEGINFLTINEKRKIWDPEIEIRSEWDVIVDLETREVDVESSSTNPPDTTQKPRPDDETD